MTQACVQLVAFEDEPLVFDSEQERNCNNHMLVAHGDELSMRDLLEDVLLLLMDLLHFVDNLVLALCCFDLVLVCLIDHVPKEVVLLDLLKSDCGQPLEVLHGLVLVDRLQVSSLLLLHGYVVDLIHALVGTLRFIRVLFLIYDLELGLMDHSLLVLVRCLHHLVELMLLHDLLCYEANYLSVEIVLLQHAIKHLNLLLHLLFLLLGVCREIGTLGEA